MLYSSSEESLQKTYEETCQLAKDFQCPKYITYITKLYDRKKEWALCYRNGLPIRSNNTYNYCEAAMRIVKDYILLRLKAFNLVHLCDFILSKMELYYEKRLQEIACGRLINPKYLPNFGKIDLNAIQKMSEKPEDHKYIVPSDKINDDNPDPAYGVDMAAGMCTCYKGKTGGPCKHQRAVAEKFNITHFNMFPIHSPEMRQKLLFIATGQVGELDFFQSLRPDESQSFCEHSSRARQELSISSEVILPPTQTSQEDNEVIFSEVSNDLKEAYENLLAKLHNDRDYFLPAIQAFLNNLKNFKTDAALHQALHTFGKYNGDVAAVTSKMRGILAFRNYGTIGLHSTSKPRRKRAVPVCGDTNVNSGRPPKKARKGDHAWAKSKGKKPRRMYYSK